MRKDDDTRVYLEDFKREIIQELASLSDKFGFQLKDLRIVYGDGKYLVAGVIQK